MKIRIQGQQKLKGEITPSGSKNSAVALIPATLLAPGVTELKNVPDITDVNRLLGIMEKLGSKITWDKKAQTIKIDNTKVSFDNLGPEDLGNMRGTSLLWGPMLSRFGKTVFDQLPGGCTLGVRPVSPHYQAFSEMGVKITTSDRGVSMDSTSAQASTVLLSEMSPTVTENALMLAVSLSGNTIIRGAASEPQVQDLCMFLTAMGAKIEGIGSSVLVVEGGKPLNAVSFEMLPDHYEIATFLAMGVTTGGEITVHNARHDLFLPIYRTFEKFGVKVEFSNNSAKVVNQKVKLANNDGLGTLVVRAQPWPALPVDTLPLFIPLALSAKAGTVLFHNWMYESGLFWTSELTKLGANIIMADPHRVIVNAGNPLYGATLEAPYTSSALWLRW